MRMELIQPFINAADAVLAEGLNSSIRVNDVTMAEEAYRRKGIAAVVTVAGDIEGRIILDLETATAVKIATMLGAGDLSETDQLVRETICELANLVIGNAITSLNDQGYKFKINPPELHSSAEGLQGTEDTEALILCFGTPIGDVFMNVAMRYNRRRRGERTVATPNYAT